MWLALQQTTIRALDELEKGSDRTIGVVAGAIVDSYLTDVLKTDLHGDASDFSIKIQSHVFQPDGPLGNFGAKISVAHLLGYFTPDAYDDLQNLKTIRNLFAHYAEHNSFETQRVKDRCANFRLINERVGPSRGWVGKEADGARLESISLSGNRISLALENHEEVLKSAKGRFISAAKLFCAALEIYQQPDITLTKPIL